MKEEKINKIFQEWQRFSEINDKLSLIFHSIPESFLPYSIEEIEEALNVISKKYFDNGEKEKSRIIQENIAKLWRYESDEKALKDMKKKLDLLLSNNELNETTLNKLKEFSNNWRKFKTDGKIR